MDEQCVSFNKTECYAQALIYCVFLEKHNKFNDHEKSSLTCSVPVFIRKLDRYLNGSIQALLYVKRLKRKTFLHWLEVSYL